MFAWLKSLFSLPAPAGPPEEIKSFGPDEKVIANDNVAIEEDAWKIEFTDERSVPLFELPLSDTDNCLITYKAKMKSDGLSAPAYLEMFCRLPGRGEFFSKGVQNPLKGSNDWAEYAIPFYLKKGQKPDLLKLNVFAGGSGTVWIKDMQVLKTPYK